MEAEGLTLHLSAKSKTGYLHVVERAIVGGPPRFQAQVGQSVFLGTHDTAVEAAVVVARHLQARGQQEEEEEEAAAAEEEEAEEEEVPCGFGAPPAPRSSPGWC